jgi:hypothetical protein
MSNKIERRTAAIRAADGEEFVLAGRALSYNEVSSNELYPGVREQIAPGAFRDSLASGTDVKALLNHDSTGLPLGRTGNGTLQLKDSADGLDFRIQLDRNNSFHQQVYASVARRDLADCSFAFQCEDEDQVDGEYNGQRCQVRTIRKASIFDVSVVNSAFYGNDATGVAARSTDAAWLAQKKDFLANYEADANRRSKAAEMLRQVVKG